MLKFPIGLADPQLWKQQYHILVSCSHRHPVTSANVQASHVDLMLLVPHTSRMTKCYTVSHLYLLHLWMHLIHHVKLMQQQSPFDTSHYWENIYLFFRVFGSGDLSLLTVIWNIHTKIYHVNRTFGALMGFLKSYNIATTFHLHK